MNSAMQALAHALPYGDIHFDVRPTRKAADRELAAELMTGQLATIVQCGGCQRSRATCDHVTSFSLPLPKWAVRHLRPFLSQSQSASSSQLLGLPSSAHLASPSHHIITPPTHPTLCAVPVGQLLVFLLQLIHHPSIHIHPTPPFAESQSASSSYSFIIIVPHPSLHPHFVQSQSASYSYSFLSTAASSRTCSLTDCLQSYSLPPSPVSRDDAWCVSSRLTVQTPPLPMRLHLHYITAPSFPFRSCRG
ncbi:hypothetical protein PAPYR_10926 [Paratrimastix pyriformis]|uniref:Uncharacterized protein n=1 Tax=Paratrimastix pyriformis TaxID=342808 RepID=A0ABQ8U8Q5_9EUKA|nr:hypothetical protein PAPYR_10926 [Paratrimastix pyriformis]